MNYNEFYILKGEVSYHQKRIRDDLFVDFGRIPQWNCPIAGKPAPKKEQVRGGSRPTPAPVAKPAKAWFIPPIQCFEPEDGVFFAQVNLLKSLGVALNTAYNPLNTAYNPFKYCVQSL